MNDFPLVAKWVSRKLAALALFLVFTSNTPAPPSVKIVAAAVVSCVYLVCQSYIDRNTPPVPPAPPKEPLL